MKGSDQSSPSSPRKQQRIHFVRHGIGDHNVSSTGYLIEDAMLTSEGVAQAKRLGRSPVVFHSPPELVVTSPLRRCMQTAYHAFGSDTPLELLPLLMETGMMRCDCANPQMGRALLSSYSWDSALEKYDALPENWAEKGIKWKESVTKRFAQTMAWLTSRTEVEIAVVSHHDFLRSNLGYSFQPAEMRTFIFSEGELRCPADPAFCWRVDGGLVSRKSPKSQHFPRVSSSPSISSILAVRRVTSTPSLGEMDPAITSPRTDVLPRKSKSVHGGSAFLKIMERKARIDKAVDLLASGKAEDLIREAEAVVGNDRHDDLSFNFRSTKSVHGGEVFLTVMQEKARLDKLVGSVISSNVDKALGNNGTMERA